MNEYESLNHTKWECKYHVVFIPKYRRKVLYHGLKKHLGTLFRTLAEQKESRIEEGHLMPDHVHMMISIPPKYAVSQVIGYIKGKSAIHIARTFLEKPRNFVILIGEPYPAVVTARAPRRVLRRGQRVGSSESAPKPPPVTKAVCPGAAPPRRASRVAIAYAHARCGRSASPQARSVPGPFSC